MAKITESELLLISKAPQEKLKHFSDGAKIAQRARTTIQKLQLRTANDRLRLARLQLKHAIIAYKAEKDQSRTVVSRAYYAMYHAARAVTYVSFGGDDHEQHSVLPTKLPHDLPNADIWKNKLKNARLERNRADYDPYPAGDAAFGTVAADLIDQAKELIKVAQIYLRSKS
ncbi:HEPN domain-containing protein [Noviherbaspirillum malthae]|uniref:HEPN domain-containing protein n=1 Tax=Noviherbaspirillum malthae TaxID=1260987 RepID=UPI00188E9342|nr:HEPN domain-containing protein [Noviherbaspirillum malthae]